MENVSKPIGTDIGINPIDRRRFIRTCGLFGAAAVTGLAGSTAAAAGSSANSDYVRGACFVPTRRMNTYQVWWRFDEDQLDTQIGYATRIHLNALRMWLSPERWWETPDEVEDQVNRLLTIADRHGIRILLCLFKNCGPVEQTPETLRDESPVTGYEVYSPAREILNNPEAWGGCYEYVDWFMDRFGSDPRLLGIEIINEPRPGMKTEHDFALAMLHRAVASRGDRPLSIGCIALNDNLHYVDHGIDVLQSHPNFLHSVKHFRQYNEKRKRLEAKTGLPYWATEWQRIRTGGLGWDGVFPKGDDWKPDYASLAPLFHRNRIGNFFWSLMLRPSYLKVHETVRWMNGVFHEDGAVYSLADARAIANDDSLVFPERRTWPDWASEVGTRLQKFLDERDQGASERSG